MQTIKKERLMDKFDTVMQYHLNMYRQGINIPIFMDFKNWDKAREETLNLARKGLLNQFYERIMKGTI